MQSHIRMCHKMTSKYIWISKNNKKDFVKIMLVQHLKIMQAHTIMELIKKVLSNIKMYHKNINLIKIEIMFLKDRLTMQMFQRLEIDISKMHLLKCFNQKLLSTKI
jgi:tRNA isopentenyl-2-thiomethyl-A-37 hydroxylase MiaE